MDAMQESLASWFDQLALKFGERRIGWDCWLQGGAVGANPADGMLDLVEQVDRVEVYVGIQDAELTQADMLSGMSFEVVAFTPPALWR